MTLLYRFPVPLSEDYARGFSGLAYALMATIFYLQLGGFVVLAALGTGAGLLAFSIASPDKRKVWGLTLTFGSAIALAGALLLATLEFFIGQW